MVFLGDERSVCRCPRAKIISSAHDHIAITFASYPLSPPIWFQSYRICIHCNQNMNLTKWGSNKKKKKKSNEKLNRLVDSLELVCLSIWGQGKEFPLLSQCVPHKRLQPRPDPGPYLRLSLEVLWVVVILLFAVRGEVSREPEILREERHLISTLRELGCQPGGCNSVHCVTLSTTVCGWKKSILWRVHFGIFVMEYEKVQAWKFAVSVNLSCLLPGGAELFHYVLIVSFFYNCHWTFFLFSSRPHWPRLHWEEIVQST